MARSRARQPISVPSNLPPLALPALPDLKAVEDVFANIVKSVERQQTAVLNIKAALSDKTALRERVALTLEQEKAQKDLNRALDQEKNRQRFGSLLGGARNLLGVGVGKGNEGKPGGTGGGLSGVIAGAELGGIFAAVAGPVGAAVAAFGSLKEAVGKAAPGVLERFDLAVSDTTAVVGQALTPVLEIVTEGIRLFGDLLASILPSTADFREALAPISDFLNDLRGALASVAPLIRTVLVEGLKILGAALKGLLIPFRLLAAFLEGLFGEGEKLKTSVGAAVRNASFQSAESFAKQANIAAFRSGIGGGKTTSAIDNISQGVNDAVMELKKVGAWVRLIAEKMGVAKENIKSAGAAAVAGTILPGSGPAVKAGIDISNAIRAAKERDNAGPGNKDGTVDFNEKLPALHPSITAGGIGFGIIAAIQQGFKDAKVDVTVDNGQNPFDEGKRRGMDGFA